MFPFPLELTIYTASLNEEAWVNITLCCPDFRKYAYTDVGRRQFLDLFTNVKVTSKKTTYSIFGKLHRDGDKPAEIWANGSQFWYKNGEQCRDGDKPAEIWADGSQFWHKNGEQHRDGDKPAEIWANGTQCWYKNGKRHRDGDNSAIIYANGKQRWYKNGKEHRSEARDKPAEIWTDGSQCWYKNGKICGVKLLTKCDNLHM